MNRQESMKNTNNKKNQQKKHHFELLNMHKIGGEHFQYVNNH